MKRVLIAALAVIAISVCLVSHIRLSGKQLRRGRHSGPRGPASWYG